jgi:SnoaL-like domain
MDEQFDFDVHDYIAIQQLVALYGHVIDDRQWSRIDELFTEDAVFDTTASGYGRREGREAILQHWKETARHPLAHHVTNVVIVPTGPGKAEVRSKGLSTWHDADADTIQSTASRDPVTALRVSSVVHVDDVVRTPDGWRFSVRRGMRMHPDKVPAPS